MGLDTVELICKVEAYFSITLPDSAAARIGTVGKLAAWLGQQLGTTGQRASAVRDAVAGQLMSLLAAEHPGIDMRPDSPLAPWLADSQVENRVAQRLWEAAQLAWPIDAHRPAGWLGRLLAPYYEPFYQKSTVDNLVDWLVARNYAQLLPVPLRSQYEVEQTVIGLTWEQTSVALPKIHLQSSFTFDLGME